MTVYIDDVHTIYLGTSQFSTGNAFDATGTPTYRIYEASTDTPILTGNFALIDDPNTVGAYSATVTLSAANGFEVGKTYGVYAKATVDGVLAANFLYSMIVRAVPATAATAAAAVWDTATYATPNGFPTTMGGTLSLTRKFYTNLWTSQGGLLTLYNDDNVTAIYTQTYTKASTGLTATRNKAS
jgi:hypothetical protein